ncbi:biotin/lipoyl-containing protein, partial [Vibrio cholerae]|uniref:biotin/lipoyl-containing protein n=1 Tax=Vibrio cholerae TaxID=666 RepID=UPI0031331A51|nr:pyruvate dehydrogenase complex dihydrolipoyllysine-residue acetyltransferase [Vibrio cholerae O1]
CVALSLFIVEGDFGSMVFPATFAGTLKEIIVATGDKVKTGSLIMVFVVAGAAPVAAPVQAAASPAAAPALEA